MNATRAARAQALEQFDSCGVRLWVAMGRRTRDAGPWTLCPNDNWDHCLQRAFLRRLLLRAATPCAPADHDASDPSRSDDFVPTACSIGLCLAMDIHRCWARTTTHVPRARRVRP